MATKTAVGDMKYNRITHNMFIAVRHMNIADQRNNGGAPAGVAQNGVMECIPVRAGDVVLMAWINVLTATTGAASADLGNGTDVDHFVNGVAIDVTTADTGQTALTGGAYRFPSADTIDMTVLDAAITAGKLEVCALIVRM
jgi:hypothetical protein